MYRYKIESTQANSNKYGNCQICSKYCSEIFSQSEERHYCIERNGKIIEGWTKQGCNDYFGHKDCLVSIRR